MLHLFFFDLIERPARQLCVVSWGLLLVVESIILLRLSLPIALIFLAAGAFLIGVAFPRSVSAIKSTLGNLGIDQVFIAFVMVATWLINRFLITTRHEQIGVPLGEIVPSLSLPQEVFGLLIASATVTMLIPALPDPSLVRTIRQLELYPAIPFTRRRTLSAVFVIGLFGIAGMLALFLRVPLMIDIAIIVASFIWAVIYWAYIYGYHSFIFYLFGALALLLSVFGICLGSYPDWPRFVFDLRLFYPVLGIPIVVLSSAVVYSLYLLWGADKKSYIVDQQKGSHTFMIAVMSLSCLLIYALYIVRPLFAHWRAL